MQLYLIQNAVANKPLGESCLIKQLNLTIDPQVIFNQLRVWQEERLFEREFGFQMLVGKKGFIHKISQN
jgi:hypothetical protein